MPRMTGIEACLEVQREVFVILMTGFSEALDEANQSIFAEACQSSRVELMMKPLDLDRVVAVLRGEEESRPPETVRSRSARGGYGYG